MPLALVLFGYGSQLLHLWVPKAADYAAPLLPILLAGYVIAIIGQFSSSMLLMGLARYRWYSRGLLAEFVCTFAALVFVIPRFGILGAAWVCAIAMVANRGLFLPFLVSRVMNFPYIWFMNSIYGKPMLIALPVYAMALWLRATILPGKTWFQLLSAGTLVGVVYYGLAFVFCLPEEHRQLLKHWVGRKVPQLRFQ